MIWKYFYSPLSSSDHGTLYQLRNKLNRTDVVKTPKNNFNACEDFIDIITAGLVISATLTTFHMDSVSDSPSDTNLQNLWTLPDNERRAALMSMCEQVYDQFIRLSYDSAQASAMSTDGIFEYTIQLLRMASFFMEFADGIREGDGHRVLRCWKYMLVMFSASGNRNYACEAANLLLQYNYTMSPRQSAQLLWSRFINTQGLPGRNIPVDLHMEHLNKLAKDAINILGSNKSESAIQRVGRAIGTLSPVLSNFDSENKITSTSSKQNRPHAHKDIVIVIDELRKAKCFEKEDGRKHRKFPKPKDALNKNRTELVEWLISKLPSSI